MRTGSSLVSLSINQANLKSQNAEQATIAWFFNFEIIVKLELNKRGVKATMVILEARLTEMVVWLSSMQTFASKFCAFVESILDGLFIC